MIAVICGYVDNLNVKNVWFFSLRNMCTFVFVMSRTVSDTINMLCIKSVHYHLKQSPKVGMVSQVFSQVHTCTWLSSQFTMHFNSLLSWHSIWNIHQWSNAVIVLWIVWILSEILYASFLICQQLAIFNAWIS